MDDKHKHTDECLTYAASTGKTHCIIGCRDSFERRKLVYRLFGEILSERDRQDEKWGSQRTLSDLRWLGIVIEEVGEAAEAILSDNMEQTRKEVIQVCASALAWIECIDDDDTIRDRHDNAKVLRVIARDVERGEVVPKIAKLPRANFLRRLASHLEKN